MLLAVGFAARCEGFRASLERERERERVRVTERGSLLTTPMSSCSVVRGGAAPAECKKQIRGRRNISVEIIPKYRALLHL